MMNARLNSPGGSRRGSSLIVVAALVAGLGTLSLALLTSVGSSHRRDRQVREEAAARYVAEAGLSEAYYELLRGGSGVLGECEERREYGGGEFWVEREDLGGGRIALTSTAVDGRGTSRVQLVLEADTASMLSFAAFGDEGLSMASNAHVDSYDSRLGSWGDQAVNGSGNDAWANNEGNVGSNHDVLVEQNATVQGDSTAGPGGATTVLGNGEVTGSTAPAPSTIELPPIEVPAIVSSGPLTVANNDTIVLPPGDHAYDATTISGELFVQGPARVVLDSAELRATASLRIDAAGGPVELYVLHDFVMNANTLVASTEYRPADLTLFLLSDNVVDPEENVDFDEVDFESNAELYGTIYAPNARIEINSNFELFGALVARAVHLDSWARIHFDEALLDVPDDEEDGPDFTRICWEELTVSLGEICD